MDISQYEKDFVKFNKGASFKFKFNIEGQEYIFKQNKFKKDSQTRPFDLIEVFASFFYREIGYENYVEYNFANYNNIEGCICKSFCSNIPELKIQQIDYSDIAIIDYLSQTKKAKIPYYAKFSNDEFNEFACIFNEQHDGEYYLSTDSVVQTVERFCNLYNFEFDKEYATRRINEHIILDYFMTNNDHNWSNVDFVFRDNGNLNCSLEYAPIFDNGNCFVLADEVKFQQENNETMAHTSTDRCLKSKLKLGISSGGENAKIEDNKLLSNNGYIVADIIQLCKQDEGYAQLVQKLKNLNITELLNKFEIEYNKTIDQNYKDIITIAYKSKVEQYTKIENRLNQKIAKSKEKNLKHEQISQK